MLTLTLPLPELWDFFYLHQWEPGCVSWGKVSGISYDCGPWVSYSHLVHIQPLAIHQNFHLIVSTRLYSQWLPFQVSHSQLCLSGCTYLSRFKGGSLSCDLSSLMGPRKVIDFPLVQHYLVIKEGVMTSKIFTCQKGHRKSPTLFVWESYM